MPPPLSTLGVFHTFATVIAIYLAVDEFIGRGRIDLESRAGKAYWILTAFGCISTVWLTARTGHFGPGHFLAILIIGMLLVSLAMRQKLRKYLLPQTILMTTTVLLSLIPSVMETLTRLPVGAPLADGPEHPLVKGSLAVAFLAYLGTIVWQIKKFKKTRT